jgi:hypothetical protein
MKRVGLIVLIVVLALGAIGVVYAGATGWFQDLTIHGTVQGATFNVAMYSNGTITNPTGSTVVPTYGPLASYNGVSPADATHGGGVTVAITNAVPGTYTIPLKVENLSNIPLTFSVGSIVADGANPLPPSGSDTGAWTITQPFTAGTLAAAGGTQSSNLVIVIPNDTPQGATYAFQYVINAAP